MGWSCFLVAALTVLAPSVVTNRAVTTTGDYLEWVFDPSAGGAATALRFVSKEHNLSSGDGLIQEGFGVGSFYVPNRRLNETLEILEGRPGRPILKFTYECDGPNIAGIRVTRLMEPLKDRPSIRVVWRLEHHGDETHWVAPWVANHVAPGGSVDAGDRIDLPSISGVIQPVESGFYAAARNWIAVTDPVAKETVYGVYEADRIFAFQAIRDIENGELGFAAHFTPFSLAPGETWETSYRIGVIRGLRHVDFATDELAVELEYEAGQLKALFSAAKTIPDIVLHTTLLDPAGAATSLRRKRFSLEPDRLIRCTYDWSPTTEGAYEFLAQLRRADEAVDLGRDTAPPHGGVDTQFRVGPPAKGSFEPWTDGPFALERQGRTLRRTLAVPGATAIWFESPLTKVFREDRVEAVGAPESLVRLSLARNERESFQIVVRPPEGVDLHALQVRPHDLTSAAGDVLPAASFRVYRVGYVPVRIPSHFENPTGDYPDPLPTLEPFTAEEIFDAMYAEVPPPLAIQRRRAAEAGLA
ncbi:MAG: hypothetical protein IH942_02185 [Acidobacteria bacterium]|nr:hypothetical protein [Acidobacteriota bacterium]